jgi:hypothetical protein
MVGVNELDEFRKADLVKIADITFALDPAIVQALTGCSLIFENSKFLIKGPDGMIYPLMSAFLSRNS